MVYDESRKLGKSKYTETEINRAYWLAYRMAKEAGKDSKTAEREAEKAAEERVRDLGRRR